MCDKFKRSRLHYFSLTTIFVRHVNKKARVCLFLHAPAIKATRSSSFTQSKLKFMTLLTFLLCSHPADGLSRREHLAGSNFISIRAKASHSSSRRKSHFARRVVEITNPDTFAVMDAEIYCNREGKALSLFSLLLAFPHGSTRKSR
jgi:hypothetical protein